MSETPDTREFWDRRAALWDRRAAALQGAADPYGDTALTKLNLEPGDRVLDVGCGPGTSTVKIARLVGPEGEAVGVDISPAMIDAAQARAAAAGAENTSFVAVDVQEGPLGTGFDAAYSRFGVMFFRDPATAFSNIASALHPLGRFAAVVWGPPEVNPWMLLPANAAAQVLGVEPQLPGPGQPSAFTLADPARVEELLTSAGFREIRNEPVEGTRAITDGEDGDNIQILVETGPLADEFRAAEEAVQRRILAEVAESFAPFKTETGWSVPGVARCITAVRASL